MKLAMAHLSREKAMQVYLHIGMHKTGTTSVQRLVGYRADDLEELGYRFFVNPIQLNPQLPQYFSPAAIREKLAEAKKAGIKSVGFSMEMLSTLSITQFQQMTAIFVDHELNLVCAFRHWASFLPSRWAQNCVRRDSQSFPAYRSALMCKGSTHVDVRYDLTIEKMKSVNPASIKIVSYDNAMTQSTILPTVLTAFDLPKKFVESLNPKRAKANQKRPNEEVDISRLFNGLFSQENGLPLNGIFDTLEKGVAADKMYNSYGRVNNYLADNPQLRQALEDLLAEQRVELVLSAEDEDFARIAGLAEEASRGYLVNPSNGKLFDEIASVDMVCSTLEHTDIPVAVREEMRPLLEFLDGEPWGT